MNKKRNRNLLLWFIIVLTLFSLYKMFEQNSTINSAAKISYSGFINEVKAKNVSEVIVDHKVLVGKLNDGQKFLVDLPSDPLLIQRLLKNNVKISAVPNKDGEFSFFALLINWFPMLLLIGVWIFFMTQMQSGGGKIMGFGKSKAKMISAKGEKITFKDVAGADEAKQDVEEIVEYLREPAKFEKLGGKIPKGVLLIGSPGTGKTLLAKAVAGEAKVPFFSISGSDFVEMFVGVGASRVRDLFMQGKKHAPCIIFIDEIDAVGRHRGAGLGGGNDEREQTLNQLLVEMDGFNTNKGVILIAATNRPDVLDPALLRPGRFDRQVIVGLPDIRGREAIIKVHTKKVTIGQNVNLLTIARGTPGFSGADLANLVNEAALIAARHNQKVVTMEDFESAKDKVLMGPERRSMLMTENEKKLTAYHEAGHALIGSLTKGSDPIHKATIVPRGRALGMVMRLPEKDKISVTREQLKADLAVAMGGRIAEEEIFGYENVTTGASSDIKQATDIARKMVVQWGMSDKMGPISYEDNQDEVFLGHSVTKHQNMSDTTMDDINNEIRKIIDEAYSYCQKCIRTNIEKLHNLANCLLTYETLTGAEIKIILKEGKLKKSLESKTAAKVNKSMVSDVMQAKAEIPKKKAKKVTSVSQSKTKKK